MNSQLTLHTHRQKYFNDKRLTACPKEINDNGVFIVTPHAEGGKFLISTKEQPKRYIYMENAIFKSEIVLWVPDEDPGPQGHWNFIIKNFQTRSFTLTTHKWPKCFIYMTTNVMYMSLGGNYAILGQDG